MLVIYQAEFSSNAWGRAISLVFFYSLLWGLTMRIRELGSGICIRAGIGCGCNRGRDRKAIHTRPYPMEARYT